MTTPGEQEEATPIGEVTHYYGKPMVAVVRCDSPVKNGDTIQVKGATTDFTMTVIGMRNDAEQEIEEAQEGEVVAFRTPEKARPGDKIYRPAKETSTEGE